MTSHDTTDRETLSALFDGELQGDARRFASRRLAHDTGWQEDCGRWQLMGDAMRRQAPIAAPADFAGRVERAIVAEAGKVMPNAPGAMTSTRRPVRLWAGGALAASLALLAVFATRTPQAVTTSAPAIATSSSISPTNVEPAPAVLTVAPAVPDAMPASVEPVAAPVAAANRAAMRLAVVEPASSRRTPATPRAPDTRATDLHPAAVAPQQTAGAVLAAATFTPPDSTNPFHVPAADPLASRPWPRAAISAGGALTASYGTQVENRGDFPSFYPFEPHTHADATTRAESP